MSSIGSPQYPPSRGSSAAGMSTPQYPPPPAISSSYGSRHGSRQSPTHGSRSSPTAEAAPVHLDPQLINPADAAPEGTAMDAPPQSPDEITPFPVEDFQEVTMRKKKTTSSGGGLGSKVKGGFGKMKGLFKKAPQAQSTGADIEDDDYDVTGSEEYLDKMTTSAAADAAVTGADVTDKQSTMQRFQNLFKKPAPPEPQMASPSPYQPGDTMTLNEPSPATLLTFGNFINVMLIVFIVVGIIMCACIGVNYSLYYLGPAFIGLAFFALVGKVFFTNCFMTEFPLESQPQLIQTTAYYAEKIIGGQKDPYKSGRFLLFDEPGYLGPMMTTTTMTTITESYAMDTMRVTSDPTAAAAAAEPKIQPSPAPSSNRSFVAEMTTPMTSRAVPLVAPANLNYSTASSASATKVPSTWG